MKLKKILRGFLIFIFLAGLFTLTTYSTSNTRCFVFTSVPINLHVTSAERVLFNGEIEINDLFGPTFFNCGKSFPLKLAVTQLNAMENDTLEVIINRHFFKYLILNFEEVEGKLVISKEHRLIRPIFQ